MKKKKLLPLKMTELQLNTETDEAQTPARQVETR
jgi:hypothetical protein